MIDYNPIFKAFMKGRMHPFYDLMYPGLLRYAAGVLGNDLAYLAEDCVQDAVMATYTHREGLEDAFHWRSYLIQSIHNRALKVVRHNGVHSSFVEHDSSRQGVEPDVSHALIRQETLDTLYAAIEALPEMYREIFDLSFRQGLRNGEIARMLDVAEITVKKRKERLISLLRGKLGGDMSSMDLLSLLYLAAVLDKAV